MNSKSDMLISGGGLVGLAMAIAGARAGCNVVLLERGSLPAQLEPEFDGRVSALSLASVRLFQHLGVWEYLAPYAEPILDIRVTDGDSPFFVHYDHRDVGTEPFGVIAENRYTRHALQQAASQYSNLTIREQSSIVSYREDAAGVHATHASGEVMACELLLAADGKHSALRAQTGIPILSHDYKQTAIVATIVHQKPHCGLAQERFLPAGPFAVLPMTEQRSSLVWVEPSDRAPLYLALSKEECEQEIAERVGGYLGKITLAGDRFAYPLSFSYAKQCVSGRVGLIGDAAHAIHPIAGQGVNLGYKDVAVLLDLLPKWRSGGMDVAQLLAQYQRWRRFDNVTMLATMHGLNQLFVSTLMPVKLARGLGLWGVNKLPPLKKFFMRHAMGLTGDVPSAFRKMS